LSEKDWFGGIEISDAELGWDARAIPDFTAVLGQRPNVVREWVIVGR
jgi:hypothetical protein